MKKNIKNILGIIGVVVYCIGCFCVINYVDNHYTRKNCEVISVDNEVVSFADGYGKIWDYEKKENEEFSVGQVADLKMYDNVKKGTEDDIILKVKIK